MLGLELGLLTYYLRRRQAQIDLLDPGHSIFRDYDPLQTILHLASENLCLGVPIFVVSAVSVYLRMRGADKSPESNG